MKRAAFWHSLFWQLIAIIVATIALTLWLAWSWRSAAELRSAYLSEAEQASLVALATEAKQAWERGGASEADAWIATLRQQENIWAVLVDSKLQSLTGAPFSRDDIQRLTFLRHLDTPVRRNRFHTVPDIIIALHDQPDSGFLAMQLPQRFMDDGAWPYYNYVTYLLPPLLASLLLGLLIRHNLMQPIRLLRQQANSLRGDNLDKRLPAKLTARHDELGELAAAFDHMADRLHGSLNFQRQLLRDLSHELRTPLSRLAVARDTTQDLASLQQRLDQESRIMRRLVENTLKLAWLDTEKNTPTLEPVSLPRLWDVIVEDVCFESGWPARRLPCLLGDECVVRGHLNGLHQAIENLVRNAIRHSPENASITLDGHREDDDWHVWIRDEGPGVDEADLQRIFIPFARLNGARPADGGFGLGLSIALSALKLQGATIWAENAHPGLALHIRLSAA